MGVPTELTGDEKREAIALAEEMVNSVIDDGPNPLGLREPQLVRVVQMSQLLIEYAKLFGIPVKP